MLEHKIDKNKFVDFCNGDVKGEDTETLNPFANDEEVEITADIDCNPYFLLCEWAESVYSHYGYVISPIRDSNLWNHTAAI